MIKYSDINKKTQNRMKKRVKQPIYREIYEKTYGEIPKGKCIHHLNGQHDDNRIENLVALSRGIHCWLHRLMKWIPKDDLIRIAHGIIECCQKFDGKTTGKSI